VIEQALLTDPEMQALYEDVLMLRRQMPLTMLHPSDPVTFRIMEYSQHFPGIR
jgi:hypothetical protein